MCFVSPRESGAIEKKKKFARARGGGVSEPAGWSEAGPEPSGSAAAGFRVPARSPARPGAAFPSTSSARPRWGAVRRRGPPTVALPGGEHHRAAEGCEHAGRALGGGRVPPRGRLAHPMTCATWARGGASGVSAGPPLRSFSSTRGRSRRAAGGSLAARTRAGLGGAPLGSGPPPGAGQRGKRATSPKALPRQTRLAQSLGQCRHKRDSPNAGQAPAKCAAKRRRNAPRRKGLPRPPARLPTPGRRRRAGGTLATRPAPAASRLLGRSRVGAALAGPGGHRAPGFRKIFPPPEHVPTRKKKRSETALLLSSSENAWFREGVAFRNISYFGKEFRSETFRTPKSLEKKKERKKKNAFENALKASAGMTLPPGPGGGGAHVAL